MQEVFLSVATLRKGGSNLSILSQRFYSRSFPLFSCGDYASGTNHTLPTNGYARQFSGVNTLSFQKHITSQEITEDGLKVLGPIVATLADCEGLDAHAQAVRIRLKAINA
jgi:histidinol dehydrogenase